MNVSRRIVTRRTVAWMAAGGPALVACSGSGGAGSVGGGAPATQRRTGIKLTTSACGQLPADLPRIDAVWAQFASVAGNTAVHEEHGSNCTTYWEKTQAMLAAGTPNDLISATPPQQALLAELGHVVDLAPLMKRDRYELADYFEPAVSQYLYKDKRIGMPRGYASQIPYMNRSMFEQGGGIVPSGSFEDRAWTWPAFLEACQRVTTERGGVQQWGYAIGGGFREWGAWIASNGGQILDKDQKRCLLDQPPALEAIQFLADLRLRHQVTPPPDVLAKQNAQALFFSGRLGMWPSTMAKVVGTGEQVQGFIFDVAAVPRGRAAALPGGGGTGWALPKASPHAEEAWQLLQFLLRTDNMTTLGDVWFPPRKSAAQGHAQQNAARLPKNRTVPFEAALRTVAPPTHPRWSEIEQMLNEEVTAVVNGERAAREAMQRAVPRVNALLEGRR